MAKLHLQVKINLTTQVVYLNKLSVTSLTSFVRGTSWFNKHKPATQVASFKPYKTRLRPLILDNKISLSVLM
jgi:hypothetical protein